MWGDLLDCNKRRNKTKIENTYDPSDTKYLLPHEFLYLLCNAKDRLSYLDKSKEPRAQLTKKTIKDYDFWDKTTGETQIKQKDPHIYLLSPTAFENQAPNYQLKK